jgi:hypothetical protein
VVTARVGGQERPQDAPGIDRRVDVVRGWVGLAQQTITVGTLGRVPVFGGFMSAGRYSHWGVDVSPYWGGARGGCVVLAYASPGVSTV